MKTGVGRLLGESQLNLSLSAGRTGSFNYASTMISRGRYNDQEAPEGWKPYPIVVAVPAIVVRPLAEIENFVSRQAVSVLVEFHLAAGGVCKITRMTARIPAAAASPEARTRSVAN